MGDEPRVALAASPREWAQRLHRHVADHGGAQVRVAVLQEQDALTEDYDVLVVDDTTSFLSRRLVHALHRDGRGVIGVYDPDDPRGKDDLLARDVDEVIERDASAEELVRLIGTLASRRGSSLPLPPPAGAHPDATHTAMLARSRPGASHAAAGSPRWAPGASLPGGRITAVAAAAGGAGATEVAVGIAVACGRRGEPTVLVDADDVAPALGQRLGRAAYPNIRAAIEALEQGAQSLTGVLQPVPGGGVHLLAGLSSSRGWAELRPTGVLEVLHGLAVTHRHVVVNTSSRAEDLPASGGPPRYQLCRQILRAAGTAVVVALPTPVGVARLLEWIADMRTVTGDAQVHVVFNRTPSSAFKRGEITEEVTRNFAPASLWFLPSDARVEEAAWAGEVVSAGAFAKAVTLAADGVLPPSAAAQRRRRRRRRVLAP